MKRTLRAVVTVVVSLGLAAVSVPVAALPDAGVMTIGSTGCCKQ